MTPEERQERIRKIAVLPAQLEELMQGLAPIQLSARPLEGEWSAAQNVHHLADSHMNAYIRLKLLITEERPTFKPYDQNLWAETPDAAHSDVMESIELLRGLHQRWVRVFQGISDDEWTREGIHPEYGRIYTPEEILRIYSGHGEAHIDQIRRTLAAGGWTV